MVDQGPDAADLGDGLVGGATEATEAAETAAGADGGDEVRTGVLARHPRLDDRVLDSEEVAEGGVERRREARGARREDRRPVMVVRRG
jgi:hypothetical protein